MKVALLTSNIGSIDEIRPPIKQTEDYELFYFTENTLPFPLPNLDNRMKGKYFKTQAHKFLDHNIFIWIDGSVEVIDTEFISTCKLQLIDCDVITSMHAERATPYLELNYIIDEMKRGSPYLLKRYAKQPFYREYKYYKELGLPRSYPLFNCYFFARHNNKRVNKMFDVWWDTVLRFSNLDQTAFSFAAWYEQAAVNVVETDKLFIRHKHE